ncbi:MAG: hypothetical protein AB7G68_18050 [Nitrospiraceae bacterium]
MSFDTLTPVELAEFRRKVMAARSDGGKAWEASRRLVEPARLPITLRQVCDAVSASPWPKSLKEALTLALGGGHATWSRELAGEQLKQLTGLPPTKAVRALCLLFNLTSRQDPSPSVFTPSDVEALVRELPSPFDLLLRSQAGSLLDLGAGDLSFAHELAAHYGPLLSRHGTPLVLHCIDRIDPSSRLGGPLHPDASRLAGLRANPDLEFRYVGDRDMFDLDELHRTQVLAPRYDIVTCWAPATPTFAYEPSRLADSVIQDDLRRTKGDFRTVRIDGEPALEVHHQNRFLLFPPWKFDIRGPLSLLGLMAMRGSLCILGAVDSQVFWETLAQLLEDSRARPADELFTPQILAEGFGEVYRRLSELPVGSGLDLGEIAELRHAIPVVSTTGGSRHGSLRFRHVTIRRGAVFPGMPASSTARLFDRMTEETPPWFVTLVPEFSDIPST